MRRLLKKGEPSSRKWRRLAVFVAVLAVIVAAYPTWKWVRLHQSLREARRHIERGEYPLALESLAAADRQWRDHKEVQFLLGLANRRAGNLTLVEPHLAKSEALGWPRDEVDRQRWLLCAQSGDFERVEDQLRTVLSQDNVADDVAEEVYEALTKGYLSSFRIQDARLCLHYWIEWRPDSTSARMLRAMILMRDEDWAAAAQDYRVVVEQASNNPHAYAGLGTALLELKKVDEAALNFNRCLAIDANHLEAALGQAECLLRRGGAAESRASLESLLQRDLTADQRAKILVKLGQSSMFNQRYDEAIALFRDALSLVPDDGVINGELAKAYGAAGKWELQQKHLSESARLQKELTRLEGMTQKLRNSPDDAELRYNIGRTVMSLGRQRDGAAWLVTAVRCDPHHGKSHVLLSEYYAAQGLNELAASHRLKAQLTGTPSVENSP